MTTLFYPALALHLQRFSRQHEHGASGPAHMDHSLTILSTPMLDTFFPFPESIFPPNQAAYFWDPFLKSHGNDTRSEGTGEWVVLPLAGKMVGERHSATSKIAAGRAKELIVATSVAWSTMRDVLEHNKNSPTSLNAAVRIGQSTRSEQDDEGDRLEAYIKSVMSEWGGAAWECLRVAGGCLIEKDPGQKSISVYFRPRSSSSSGPGQDIELPLQMLREKWHTVMGQIAKKIDGEVVEPELLRISHNRPKSLTIKVSCHGFLIMQASDIWK